MQTKPLAGAAPAAPVSSVPTPMPAPANAAVAVAELTNSFIEEIGAILKQSRDARKSLVFHVQGTHVAGVVKEIHKGSVIVSNHEHSRILIRLERIDAVEGD